MEGAGSEVGFGKRGGEFRLYRLCCVVIKDRRRRSLFGGLVRFQELLGECVDLVGASDLVWQQRQFDYVEVLVEILHLWWRQEQPFNRTGEKTYVCSCFCCFFFLHTQQRHQR